MSGGQACVSLVYFSIQVCLHVCYSVCSWDVLLSLEPETNHSNAVQPSTDAVSLVSFQRKFDRFTPIFCSAVLFWHSVLFYTCNVWIRSICHELKELSFLLSGLLKSRPKHYLTQQRLWWKFLLEAAWSQPTVGIVLGFWCVMPRQDLANCPLLPFTLLQLICRVPHLKCVIKDNLLNMTSHFKWNIMGVIKQTCCKSMTAFPQKYVWLFVFLAWISRGGMWSLCVGSLVSWDSSCSHTE